MYDQKVIDEEAMACTERRKSLSEGPWMTENDRVEFKHNGLQCLVRRNPHLFAWCGYVGVESGHPLHGQDADDENSPAYSLEVPWGITHTGDCSGAICHKPADNESDKLWWFGFDCAHANDLVPGLIAHMEEMKNNPLMKGYPSDNLSNSFKGHYWTESEVIEETKKLAEQISRISGQ